MSGPDLLLPPERLRSLQIVAGALVFGVAALLGIALFIVTIQDNGRGLAHPAGWPFVSIGAVLLFILSPALAYFLANMQMRIGLRKVASGAWQPPPKADPSAYTTDAAKLFSLRQTSLLLILAPLEGAANLCCIAYMLEAQTFVLGFAIVAMLLMLANFPTQRRVQTWLERQSDRLAELRQQPGFVGEG